MKLSIAADHAGFELKNKIIQELSEHQWEDLGPKTPDSVDYPDFAKKLTQSVLLHQSELGILICGTGIGMSIAANKVKGIRAALVWDTEMAKLTRQHNNSNVLCLSSKFTDAQTAIEIVKAWIATPFSQEERHNRRIQKIAELEK